MGIQQQSKVYIHQGQFIQNNNGNLYLSNGGAIHVGNSTLRVTNSRFDQNRAGTYGGAVYVIGNWTGLPRSTPQSDVIIANSLFTNNSAVHDQTSNTPLPTEGGAINIEDQSLVRVYNSRFINNTSDIAGAINSFRASVEVYGSVFLGNQANDTSGSSGFGGSISLNSNDGPGDGTDNKPNASLLLENSWLQGRYGSTTTSAISGGCLFANGDGPRLEDDATPNAGTVADNRARVTINQSVFYDCDTHPSGDGKGASGAIYTVLTDLTFQNSVVVNSNAELAPNLGSMGGGFSMLYNTTASITGATLAGNTANTYGGGMFIQGSNVSITGSKIFENSGPGYGSAIFSSVDDYRKLNVTGSIENNVISNNPGYQVVFDDDRNVQGSPYNAVLYNGNNFYKGSQSTREYWDTIGGGGTATNLNNLVVKRPNIGATTDKSPQNNNTSAQSKPVLGTILAAPSYTLSNMAIGEGGNPPARVIYTWSGGSAQFNGGGVNGIAGTAAVSPGTQIFTVGGSSFTANVTARPNPSASFSVSASAVNWAVISGSFLDWPSTRK